LVRDELFVGSPQEMVLVVMGLRWRSWSCRVSTETRAQPASPAAEKWILPSASSWRPYSC